MPIGFVSRVADLYRVQNTYGERLRAYKVASHVVQSRSDTVNISAVAVESHSTHKKAMHKEKPIVYGNPNIVNGRF